MIISKHNIRFRWADRLLQNALRRRVRLELLLRRNRGGFGRGLQISKSTLLSGLVHFPARPSILFSAFVLKVIIIAATVKSVVAQLVAEILLVTVIRIFGLGDRNRVVFSGALGSSKGG